MGSEKHKQYVYSKEIDDYFINKYNFEYDNNEWRHGYALVRLFWVCDVDITVVMAKDLIFIHDEHWCKAYDTKIKLDDKDISIEKLEKIMLNRIS